MSHDGGEVLLVSTWAGDPPHWLGVVRENHLQYAERNGFGVHFSHEPLPEIDQLDLPVSQGTGNPARPATAHIKAVWRQIKEVRRVLEDSSVRYVFKSDCDSLFMNWSVGFQDLVALKADFIFTGDAWDLFNGGHFLIRNGSFARDFLDLWLRFEDVSVPPMWTTHQSNRGLPSDQPAMNVLLHGGSNVGPQDFVMVFNEVNGFSGNPYRRHRYFQYTHAPTRTWRLRRARSLIHQEFAERVAVVDQNRMNSYLSRLPGARSYIEGDPILHLVGAKERAEDFAVQALTLNK